MSRIAPTVVLGVLLENGRSMSRTRLMKILFLIRQKTSIGKVFAYYDFLPYKYGPYSFIADRDIFTMIRAGMLTGNTISISEDKKKQSKELYSRITGFLQDEIRSLILQYRYWTDKMLVDDIYKKYPNYTVLSKRSGKHQKRFIAPTYIYTIGYEGTSVDSLLKTLIQKGIFNLIDVRNNPFSRRFGFSKKTLDNLCEKVGINYFHIPELGIPSKERSNLHDFASYQRLLDFYEIEVLPYKKDYLFKVAKLIEQKSTALLCFEKNVHYCHRSRLAKKLAEITKLPIHHLEVCND